jgi:hypothetical protein
MSSDKLAACQFGGRRAPAFERHRCFCSDARSGGNDELRTKCPSQRTEVHVGKVIWHVTTSVDGFIAGPEHSMVWMGSTAAVGLALCSSSPIVRRRHPMTQRPLRLRWHRRRARQGARLRRRQERRDFRGERRARVPGRGVHRRNRHPPGAGAPGRRRPPLRHPASAASRPRAHFARGIGPRGRSTFQRPELAAPAFRLRPRRHAKDGKGRRLASAGSRPARPSAGLRAEPPWEPEVSEDAGIGEPGDRRDRVPLEREHDQPVGARDRRLCVR